jgi:hypothetical protein
MLRSGLSFDDHRERQQMPPCSPRNGIAQRRACEAATALDGFRLGVAPLLAVGDDVDPAASGRHGLSTARSPPLEAGRIDQPDSSHGEPRRDTRPQQAAHHLGTRLLSHRLPSERIESMMARRRR